MSRSYDVGVVGAGPGGYACAFRAADLGLSVVLVDEGERPGGVCLFRGCIPSKALLHVVETVHAARDASEWGLRFGEPEVDLPALRAFKSGVVDRLTRGLGRLSEERQIRFVQGRASLASSRQIEVATADGATERIDCGQLVLATGSRPARPRALALASDRVMDSTAALELPEIPRSLLVVGGGYIGLELGSVYAALGSSVSVVEMTEGLLPGVDRDLVSVLEKRLAASLEAIHLETRVARMKETASAVRVAFEGGELDGKEEDFETVLVAVGREPNSSLPGLERTAVQLDDRGFVAVDGKRRTAEPSVYAIGDLAGEPMLAHKASAEGKAAAEAMAGEASAYDPSAVPAVVFTDPEIAWCGLTETEAKSAGESVEVARFPWQASGRALTLGRPQGLTKLVIDRETDRVLGAGFAGASAGELVAEAVLAVEMGATAADLALTIHPHPTLSETVMEAAEVYLGHPTHVAPRRRKNRD